MRTLIPPSARGAARPLGRSGRVFGFGLTRRALWLVVAGFVLALPAFWYPRAVWFMAGWDVLLLLLVLWDLLQLPHPKQLTVSRDFVDSPQLGVATRVELSVTSEANGVVEVRLTDDLHPALVGMPESHAVTVYPREPAKVQITLWPRERGDFPLRRVYLRYHGALALAERWAAAELMVAPENDGKTSPQRVRIFPAHEQARGDSEFFLMRARQLERQRRQQRLRGSGREFESLRDYQPGDELRAVSWTATARRGRIVTRQFMAERSQQVWVVLDAGRLSRTAFALQRGDGPQFAGETEAERDEAHRLTVTQLDQATTAAVMLAQIVGQTGDKLGMLAYGTAIQQVLLPGAGTAHLRLVIDLLSATRSEAAEGDSLLAVARLKQLQRRRGLIIWITELPDSLGRPPLVTAAAILARLHLVVLVVLKHPELEQLANALPATPRRMFHAAAATEMGERCRDTIARLERLGVLVVEAGANEVGVRTVSEYLEIKSRGLL